MVTQMRIYFIKLMALLILNSSIFAQDGLDLKNDNAQADEDGSVTIKVLKNDGIKDKSNLILEITEKPKFEISFSTPERNSSSLRGTSGSNIL